MNSDTGEHEARREDLFDRAWVRLGLFVAVPLVIFVLVCAGIRVSQYGVDHTVVVLGLKELRAGRPAALRVALIADGAGFVLPTRLEAWLVAGERRLAVWGGPVHDAGEAASLNFDVPDWPPGPAVVEIDISFGGRRRLVRAEVEIVDRLPPERLVVPEDTRADGGPSRVRLSGKVVEAFTEDRGAPTGLTSVLFLRALDPAGAPAAVPVEYRLPGSGSEKTTAERTDRLGLIALPIRPLDTGYPVTVIGGREWSGAAGEPAGGPAGEFVVEGAGGSASLLPPVVFNGITAAVHAPIARHDEPIRISVSQVSRGGAVYLDLFAKDGSWIWAGSAPCTASGAARIDLRPPTSGLLRLQATGSALMPGATVAVRHLYVLERDESPAQGLRSILGRLESSPIDGPWAAAALALPLETGAGFERRMAAAFALSRLYRGHGVVERLVSSRREDDAELAAFKNAFQRGVMLAILLIGLGVVGLIGTIALQAHRRQERITLMIAAEDDGSPGDGGWITDVGAREGRGRLVLQGLVLLLIVLGAFVSVALLVATMTWGQ